MGDRALYRLSGMDPNQVVICDPGDRVALYKHAEDSVRDVIATGFVVMLERPTLGPRMEPWTYLEFETAEQSPITYRGLVDTTFRDYRESLQAFHEYRNRLMG